MRAGRKRIGRGVAKLGKLPQQIRSHLIQQMITHLETELAGVENAIDKAMWVVERKELEQRRSQILGELKKWRDSFSK
jgi:uncharacterized protein YbcI